MRDFVLPLVVALCTVGAYHVFVAGADNDTHEPTSAPSDEPARSEAPSGSGPGLDGRTMARRLDALEARIDALAAGAQAPPPPKGDDEARPGDDDYVWDDRALDWLQAAIVAVRHRDLRARHAAQFRELVARATPEASEQRREEAVTLILAFQEDARRLYPGGSAGDTPEAREETARKLTARRLTLQRDLRALFGDDAAAKILGGVPGAYVSRGAPAPKDGE